MNIKLATILETTINESITTLNQIDHDAWFIKKSPTKWSKKEIVGHLIDSALSNIQRFVRIQYDDQTNIYYEQDLWVKANDYQGQDIDSVLLLWKALNLQIVRIWRNADPACLYKTIPVKDEDPTFEFLMQDYIDHLQHHLGQVLED